MSERRPVLRFGDFVLDIPAYELLRKGRRVRLERQPMELLILLVERRPDLVTRSEIADRLWGREVFVDVEAGIHTAVRKLRQALRDSAEEPALVLTVPGKGYRFIGVAEPADGPSGPLPAPEGPIPQTYGAPQHQAHPPARRVGLAVVVLGLLAGAVVLTTLRWGWRAGRSVATQPAAVRPVAATSSRIVPTRGESAGGPAFSPDGRMLAFHQWPERQVWVQSLDGADARRLTSDGQEGVFPTWVPEGDRILFTRHNEIWSVALQGGPPQRLIADGRFPSVSGDGRLLVFEGVPPDRGIYLSRPDGSGRRLLLERTTVDEASGLKWAHATVSPDGRLVAFLEQEAPGVADLWVVPTSGGRARRLTYDKADTGRPAWMPDSQTLVFHSSRRGSQTIWRMSANGGSPEPVTTGAGQDRNPAISVDGRQLVYQNVRFGSALVFVDPALGRQHTLIESRENLFHPRVSPDGRRLTYFTRVDGAFRAFVLPIGPIQAGAATSLTTGTHPRWSSDGRFIYVVGEGDAGLRKVGAEDGGLSEAFGWPDGRARGGERADRVEVAPDERAFVVAQTSDDVVVRTVVVDRATGREVRLSLPLTQFRWTRDGEWIVGTSQGQGGRAVEGTVAICRADTGQCRQLGRGYHAVPTADGRRVLFLRVPDEPALPVSLWAAALDGSGEVKLTDLPEPLPSGLGFDVATDGRVVYSRFIQSRGELWVSDLGK